MAKLSRLAKTSVQHYRPSEMLMSRMFLAAKRSLRDDENRFSLHPRAAQSRCLLLSGVARSYSRA